MDAHQALQLHAATQLDELVSVIEPDAVAAAEQVNHAAQHFLRAVERRAEVEHALTAVVALTRRMSPGDVVRARSDEAAQKVATLLAEGGEAPPLLRLPVAAAWATTFDALRQPAAREHGLPAEAEAFLTGTSLAELDESAALLSRLLGERREQKPTRTPGPFTDMAAAKARRKQQLAEIFTGRVRQPRDTRGRFATDFSPGARTPVPPSPESHEQWLMRTIRSRAADTGRSI